MARPSSTQSKWISPEPRCVPPLSRWTVASMVQRPISQPYRLILSARSAAGLSLARASMKERVVMFPLLLLQAHELLLNGGELPGLGKIANLDHGSGIATFGFRTWLARPRCRVHVRAARSPVRGAPRWRVHGRRHRRHILLPLVTRLGRARHRSLAARQ